MAIRINNLSINIDESIDELKNKAAKKLKISEKDIKRFKILRESLDARRKNNIRFNYSVELTCDGERKIVSKIRDGNIKIEEEVVEEKLVLGTKKMKYRPDRKSVV